MKISLCCCLLLAFGLAAQAAGSSGGQDERKIRALYDNWRHAVQSSDIPAYVAVLHPAVRLIPPGADAIDGADNYAAFLAPVFAAADYRLEVVTPPVITVVGELAIAEYEYIVHLTLKDPLQGVTEAGALTAPRTQARYLDVLRRDEQGNWRVWRHIWQEQ